MIRDILLWLVTAFVVEPVQTNLERSLQAANVPQQVIRDVRSCVAGAPPALADRVSETPGWAVGQAIGLMTGQTNAESVLSQTVPGCAPAIAAARAVLGRGSNV